jgi:ATP-dependent helicase/DNAse subunit B
MGKGIVFIAPHGARNKKSALFEEIVSHCTDGDYSSVLYITPAAFSLGEARRQFFSYLKTVHKKKAYIPFQSFTIKNLCINLYETFMPLQSAKENEDNPPSPPFNKGGMGGFKIISDRIEPLILCEILGEKNIGYARLLSGLLSKIRHYILDRELPQIKEDIKSLIFEEKTMARAVKAIETLEVYEKRLEERGLIDFENAIKKSIPLIKEYLDPSILILDGFFDPTPLELEVIKTLIEKAEGVYVLVEENAEFLKFFEPSEESKKWGLRSEKLRKTISPREGVGYYPYPSMEDEVEGIARGVKALILEGVKPGEIVVSFPALSKYLPMLKRVFQKHGIPVNIAEYDLSSTKPFIALEDMITSIENDYPRNEFLSFLTSAYLSGIPKIIKEWAVSFSSKAGIVKGGQAWLSIKETLLNFTEEDISGDRRKVIDEFQRELKKIINTLEKLRQAKNLLSFADELEAVLNRFGFFDSLTEQGLPQILEVISNQLAELRHFGELYGSDEKTGFYLRYLLKGLKGRDEDIDGVRVVPFELAAGLECKALFFGGMIEGDFPSKPEIDPVLPEKVKKSLGIPFLEYYLDRQKRYFKRLLNVSTDEPYFSYPVADGDNIFLQSPFLDWGTELRTPELDVFTEEEILIRNGLSKQRDFSEILWNGKLSSDKDIKSILMQGFGSKTFFRVTDIDAYRQCPLRFYIERFLCLETEKPPKFEVEAMLWGKLAHRTMEYLYKDGVIELDELDKRLFKGLELSLKQFPIGDFWSRVAREIFQRLLPMLKEQETDIRMQGFSPYMVEHTIKTTINNLRLKGKIDRVDSKTRNSKLETRNSVVLLDYKTGSIDRDSLQLPLYAGMWQKENGRSVEKVGFYSLKDGYVDWYPKKISMEEFIDTALQSAEDLVQRMRKGIFEPTPFKDTECRYCWHSALCKKA